jgi:hypothetical protein
MQALIIKNDLNLRGGTRLSQRPALSVGNIGSIMRKEGEDRRKKIKWLLRK